MITFALTVLADLTVAVEVGHGAGCAALHLPRDRDHDRVHGDAGVHRGRPAHILQDKDVPPYVTILRIHGPFLFGTTDKLVDATADLSTFAPDRDPAAAQHDRHRRHRPARAGVRSATGCEQSGRHCCSAARGTSRRQFLEQAEFVEHVGAENIVPHVEAALARANEIRAQAELEQSAAQRT